MNKIISICLLQFVLLLNSAAQVSFQQDILGANFQMASILQPDDYEGKVTCTLIRKLANPGNNKAVLYIHGFNDYFFQEEMANKYTDAGYMFYGIDLRKYGRSWMPNQKLNNVRDLHEYFADIDTALKIIKAEGAAFTLLSGHSTGGLLVSLYASEHRNSKLFNAVFLNSPFYDFNENWFKKKIGIPLLAKKGAKKPDKIVKGGLSALYGESLHQSAKGEWNYNLEWKPHIAPPVNYGWLHAIYFAQKEVKKGLIIAQPVLLMHSNNSVYTKIWTNQLFTGDAVLNVNDIAKRGAKIEGNRTIVIISNGMHDLVLSPKPVREVVYQELFAWLKQIAPTK